MNSSISTEECWDYVSEGLVMIKLDDLFPNMVVGDRSLNTWNYLRCEVPHLWYVDRRSPIMGFISRDEAAILYNLALAVRSKPALEIGCWRGWSTAHIAAAGVALDVIDPILMEDEINQEINAILRAQRTDRVRLHGGYSPEAIFAAHKTRGEDWGLIFIDGDHEGNAPSIDAANACLFAADDAMILFHDLSSPSVAAGLGLLRERGWNTMVYQTMQIMGVAWRGNVTPVHHIPDPRVNWSLPAHLESYPVSGETLSERCKRLEQLAAHAIKHE
ncbi:MAG: class I SAM-dependent methyltransferase, partial [Verrucomicrobiales bacterium]|nr:class I SAM-dependent methyltransferase [Verrucomicrobiales bacterium]